ncbi:MAG: hypothetical protein M3071_15690, partial [Actinomycetota bacterium]|nr:hypothetical protein [Actinomycetota bacterium]
MATSGEFLVAAVKSVLRGRPFNAAATAASSSALWREEGLRVPQRRRKRQRLGISTVAADRLRADAPD